MSIFKPFKGNTREEYKAQHIKREDFLLCHNCGWNAEYQSSHSYISTIKCTCNARRGIWFIGEKYVLKEREILEYGHESSMGPDVAIQKFLSENSTIPVIKDIIYWKDSNSHFFFMEKAPGTTLMSIFGTLTHDQMRAYAKEVVEYLVQLRKFTSTKIEGPDGSRLRDRILGPQFQVHYVTDDVEEWWAQVEPHLVYRRGHQISTAETELWKKDFKSRYPVIGGPYVLTHSDLDATNIMVKDGHVSAIIDWEHGGYLPEWWEAVGTLHVQPGYWSYCLKEEMIKQIGPWPTTEVKFHEEYMRAYTDKRGPALAEWKYFDRNLPCPNYANYIKEDNDGPQTTYFRSQREAREAATLAAFKALNLEERENLIRKKDS
ncbi:hypothetical protein OCU04_000379 [Sclerotinia nivalis]|uniref:Aminoglycoside phosphotransferase domain-containing protein n=1 Tax=Sclerotinia nivalis TaxID=352851 RepID=A0A9X0DPP4_9HELO|nr:hypothetical protein OCU04_000379 [Sclerotinia nivalis]